MATIEQAFLYHCQNAAGITALIGTRFYPEGGVPESPTTPFATYERTSIERQRSQSGKNGLVQARIQVVAWAETQLSASAIAKAFADVLDQYRGSMGAPAATVAVRGLSTDPASDQTSPPIDASATGMFATQVDFVVWYVET